MKKHPIKIPAFVLAASLAMLGCPAGDDADTGNNDTGSETTDSSPPTTTAPTTTTPTTTSPDTTVDTTSPDTTVDTSNGTTDTTPDTESSSSSGDPTVFEFLPNGPEDYAQVDRKGFPAVNTGLNLLGDKDAYNAGSPVDDAMGAFEDDALDSLYTLHVGLAGMEVPDNTGLDDDLAALDLTPCNGTGGVGDPDCEDQAFPFVQPDTLGVDLDDAAGFPNGRALPDQAIDVILAVLLLSLEDHMVTTFASIPLNPGANDVEFPAEFPYLAPAN